MGNQLGRRIRALRQRAELSVTALAGDELSVATVSRIEHGGMEPSLGTLRYLAGRLDCTVADLLVEDDNALAIHAALEEIEAWFLLARPDRALDRSLAALEACAEVAGDVGLPPHQATLQRRLRGALLRSRTLLDPSAAPELDTAISQARRLGDIWLVARLCAVRAPTLEPEAALVTLQTALRLLPPTGNDSAGHQLCRGELFLLLAQRFEAVGEVETTHGLYTTAATLGELFRQPATWAGTLLNAAAEQRPGLSDVTMRYRGGTSRRGEAISPGFALAAQVAGLLLWRRAWLELARLDVQARRLQDAARRLRVVYAASASSADLPVLGGFWSELEHSLTSRRAGDASFFSVPHGLMPPALQPDGIDDLVRLETAVLAGRLTDAEQIGALLATSLGTQVAPLAHAIWLRLALAWAEAGNAPRAARALRAARQAGQ